MEQYIQYSLICDFTKKKKNLIKIYEKNIRGNIRGNAASQQQLRFGEINPVI